MGFRTQPNIPGRPPMYPSLGESLGHGKKAKNPTDPYDLSEVLGHGKKSKTGKNEGQRSLSNVLGHGGK